MAELIHSDATVFHFSSKKTTHKNWKKNTTAQQKGGQVAFLWRVLTNTDTKVNFQTRQAIVS